MSCYVRTMVTENYLVDFGFSVILTLTVMGLTVKNKKKMEW